MRNDNWALEEVPESLEKDDFNEHFNSAIAWNSDGLRGGDIIFAKKFFNFLKISISVLALKFLFRNIFLLWKQILKAREKAVRMSPITKRLLTPLNFYASITLENTFLSIKNSTFFVNI